MNFEELTKLVQEWAEEKDLDDWETQFGKLIEEVFEFKKELDLYDDAEFEFNRKHVIMEAGDVLVTLINTLRPLGIDPTECLEMAYKKIKDRQGEVIDGTFVKEEDLDD